MIRTTLTVPAEIARTVRQGVLIELEHASASVLALCEPQGEKPRRAYKRPIADFHAASALLDEIGYTTPKHPVAFEVDLTKHRAILLRVLCGQQQADIDMRDETSEDEQNSGDRRVQILEKLAQVAGGTP